MNKHFAIHLFLLLVLTSCTATALDSDAPSDSRPTPTTFPFFEDLQGSESDVSPTTDAPAGVPTVAGLFTERDTPTPRPSATPRPTVPPTQPDASLVDLEQENLSTHFVFDDALNENWEIIETLGATVDMSSDIRVMSGDRSIAFTPQEDFTSLYFAVKPEATAVYSADQVLGLDFWINGGDDYIQLDQLALAIIGSNDHPFWSADDDSVAFPQGETFSETRLYFLGLNRSIPPNTWVEIYLQMDTLVYDPEYNYVVGFYLKNDMGFRNTVYIDDISLVVLGDIATPETTSISTPTPSNIPEATANPIATPETPVVTLTETAVPTPETTPNATATPEAEACVISPPSSWVQYTVQPGDNISNMAFDRGESTEFVLRVNCFSPGVVLSVGQKIWLPPAP